EGGSLMTPRGLAATVLLVFLTTASCGGSGGGAIDGADLALVSHQPNHGESAVPRNSPIRLFFNATVDASSVDDQSILVRVGGTFQTRPVGQFLVTGDVVEFDPTVSAAGVGNALGFAAGEQVFVKVPLKGLDNEPEEKFVRGVDGDMVTVASGGDNFTFVTGTAWIDPVPGAPEIVGLDFSPVQDGLGRVTSSATVTLVFNEPVDPTTFALGKNIFLTNNTLAAGESIYQKDVPSLVFFDGSLTRYTLQPVFGFGQGPYTIRVGFFDPDAPVFFIDNPPRDLVGTPVGNTLFSQDFGTLEDPNAQPFGVVTEDFLSTAHRDAAFTDARWGDDPQFPRELVGQQIVKRNQQVNIAAITGLSGGITAIDNAPLGLGEEDYCPAQNPLVGSDSLFALPNPPASAGRRQLNLYRQAELGARGTVVRVAWGPDSDATFASSYPDVILRLGHKEPGKSLASGVTLSGQFDVDGFVTVVNKKSYSVPQAFDVNGNLTNDGYLNWPSLDLFFDYDGESDLILDVEAKMGSTFQTFRTFIATDGIGICTCFNTVGCVTNTSIGLRQMDGIYGGDAADPAPPLNPLAVVSVMEFEIVTLRSDARSVYYDTAATNPDYISAVIGPLVQAGGAAVSFRWSASFDGIVEDVPFTPNINACDGHRHIRWSAVMHSNLFTHARPRVQLIQIPYVVR
ncbi:MAG: Ig-like domain-containing protein, partial [Actinobacteria bacterium]|nr:Ig-like domain-containing protein [Actinomycetota bacterium]